MITSASNNAHASVVPTRAVPAARMTAPPPYADCFDCFIGGYGSPHICDSDEHFDRASDPGFFSGTMHIGCAPLGPDGRCPHDFCQPTFAAVYGQVERALIANDTRTLRALVASDPIVKLDSDRQSLEVLGCDNMVGAFLPLTPEEFTAIAD
jgi:hypothetical protein